MIFSSWQYLLFLPVVVFLFWRTNGAVRLAIVVAASYFFYMSWMPVYGLLLFALTSVNWALGLALGWARNQKPLLLKPLLWSGLLLNLGVLCYYKYANFFITNLFAALRPFTEQFGIALAVPGSTDWPLMNLILPLGISFFVFEFVHYVADVYKGDKPVRSWMEFAAFAAFFPSQIAGPIKRYQDFLENLRNPEPRSTSLTYEGMTLIVQGLFKKVAIADPIGVIVLPAFAANAPISAADSLLAMVGFTIQVYCDFSGYTDIGRGSALLMGIRLPVNFQLPYLSNDLADFWRRWHMSLSFWLRDYCYIPLGGSRDSRLIQWRNLFVTMVACGLWHGAAWHYVVFGCLQGLGLIVNREWKNLLKQVAPLSQAMNTAVGKWFGTFLTMLFITATYGIFRAPDMPHAFNLFNSLGNVAADCTLWLPTVKSGVMVFLGIYMGFWLLTEALKHGFLWKPKVGDDVLLYPAPLRYAAWTGALVMMMGARPTEATPFVYFQF